MVVYYISVCHFEYWSHSASVVALERPGGADEVRRANVLSVKFDIALHILLLLSVVYFLVVGRGVCGKSIALTSPIPSWKL